MFQLLSGLELWIRVVVMILYLNLHHRQLEGLLVETERPQRCFQSDDRQHRLVVAIHTEEIAYIFRRDAVGQSLDSL